MLLNGFPFAELVEFSCVQILAQMSISFLLCGILPWIGRISVENSKALKSMQLLKFILAQRFLLCN